MFRLRVHVRRGPLVSVFRSAAEIREHDYVTRHRYTFDEIILLLYYLCRYDFYYYYYSDSILVGPLSFSFVRLAVRHRDFCRLTGCKRVARIEYIFFFYVFFLIRKTRYSGRKPPRPITYHVCVL